MSNGEVTQVIDGDDVLEPLKGTPKNYTLHKTSDLSLKSRAKKQFREKVPIVNWIGGYNNEFAINDFISGITLGLTIIPESIACALLAGLPPFYGLCSVFIGSFIYLVFGTINTVIVGPTSLVALVTIRFTIGKPIEFNFILTFLAGVVELIMGMLQLGFIFEFISMPVIKAFSTATAFLVIESQVKVLLGIKYLVPGFVESIRTLTYKIDEARLGDFCMGAFAIAFLLGFQYLGTIRVSGINKNSKFWNSFLRYLSLCRNTLVVAITSTFAAVWAYCLSEGESLPFRLSRNSVHGLPNFTFPSFYIETEDRSYNFFDILSELNFGIIVIPIIGLMTNISIGKLDPKGLVQSNQELLTLGLCNIVGSGVQSMPVSGAFSRAAISSASGIKTPMANLYSGIIVILALSFLSPYFNFIPESTLAAILVCALFSLIDFKIPIRLWRESKRDFITWVICFLSCVFYGVEVGLFVGITVTVAHLLYLWARPEIEVKIEQIGEMQYISLTPENGIYFPAINYLREKVLKACTHAEFQLPVVIHCHKMNGLDFTAAQGFSKLCGDICSNGQIQLLILYQMNSNFQKFVDIEHNLIFCESEEKLREILLQEQLKNGYIALKDHIRASIDLGYKIDMERLERHD